MGSRGLLHYLPAIGLAASSLLALAPGAQAAPEASQLRGTMMLPPPAQFHAGTDVGSRILFLNRCEGGCVIQPGFEDSRTDHSSIFDTARTFTEFRHSDAQWNTVVQCVRELYKPFDVVVTDTDPGDLEHSEVIVAGTAAEGGFLGAGGVAPFACYFIDNAISFVFANNYQSSRTICNVVGQESAHGFGLDHELLCEDPLTYLSGCPDKSFQDVDAECGEMRPRECFCGGDTQNSFQYLETLFGPGLVPTVAITAPLDGSRVGVGFSVLSSASDDGVMTHAELRVDNALIESLDAPPFVFHAPKTLSPGAHEVQVRVYDDRGQYGSQSITIEQEACVDRNQCDFSYLCLGGQCSLGPGNEGGLGASCQESDECQSLVCARERNLPKVCTAFCDLAPESCPHGYNCLQSADGRRVCMIDIPTAEGGFCSASGAQSSGLAQLLMMLLALCGTRRAHGKARNRRPQI